MISFKWKFEALDVELGPVDGHTDIVFSINYRLIADDGEGHSAEEFGTVNELPMGWSDVEPWIEYVDISDVDVRRWVKGQLGGDELAAITQRLQVSIEEQVTPTHEIRYTMPWDEDGA